MVSALAMTVATLAFVMKQNDQETRFAFAEENQEQTEKPVEVEQSQEKSEEKPEEQAEEKSNDVENVVEEEEEEEWEYSEVFARPNGKQTIKEFIEGIPSAFVYFYRGKEQELAQVASRAEVMKGSMGVQPVLLDLEKYGDEF